MSNCKCDNLRTRLKGNYTSVNDTVSAVAEKAMEAYCQGTFSVGGMMLDSEGNLLNTMHNNVVMNNKTNDPTAHGERQLVDWYYDQIAKGVLMPPPNEITIVTSLDPCCMCSGSILTSGFKVVSASFDTFSGINYNTQADFPSLDPKLRPIAQETFSYPEVVGTTCFARPASSAAVPAFFTQQTIAQNAQALCTSVFNATLTQVQNTVNNDLPPEQLLNPQSLAENDPIIEKLKSVYRDALTYVAPARGKPDLGLASHLIRALLIDYDQGGDGNAVAFLDYFGNLLLCLPGNQTASAIQTAFMSTTRSYAKLRYELREDPDVGERALKYLCHPKYGTFVFARGPNSSSKSLIDFGAYGSTMEEKLPAVNPLSFQYVVASMTQADLTQYCQGLPPLYSEAIGVYPTQVKDQLLIDEVMSFLPENK